MRLIFKSLLTTIYYLIFFLPGTMLWGTSSWESLGPVVMVEHALNATKYLNIIVDQLHPYMASVFSTGNGMLEQGNALRLKA